MNCSNCRTGLIGFLQGDINQEEKLRFEDHLASCEECRQFAQELKGVFEVAEREKNIKPDPFLSTRIIGILEKNSLPHVSRKSIPGFIGALALSLVILAGVIGGIGIGNLLTSGSDTSRVNSNELTMIINDIEQEPIESFLLGL